MYQTVHTKPNRLDRSLHIWRMRKDGSFKCVICGGVTRKPSDNDLPEKFERLSDEDRELCPRQK